ncbi:DUF3844 domain-containing protein [Aspergillus mulundensis]|uniref:EGF-like domain-containing protein n=1 Tax=Aspergillus mulundensis TaxID=1810919 RepID=A0A3D8S6H9_9EURO|nr:hypothetical protein DSM5745_05367 [Aspergillus mulundensis]RDW81810.1 hypothetical protein DSM5745_05367 [Aspergillus mulundensis]
MRSFFSFLTTLAAFAVGTTALEASVINFGPETRTVQDLESRVISSATLQRLLELWSKSPTTSSLYGSDDDDIEILSKLAGSPTRLFGALAAGGGPDILVVLEGLTGDTGMMNLPFQQCSMHLTVQRSGISIHDEYRSELLTSTVGTDFLDVVEGVVSPESKHCSFSHPGSSRDSVKSCLPENLDLALGTELLNQVIVGESWVNDRKGLVAAHIAFKSEGLSGHSKDLKSFLADLHSLSLNGRRVAAIVLSGSNAASKPSHAQSAPKHAKLNTRDTQSMTTLRQTQMSLSLAPMCYASNSSCNDATNACSGHGACYEKTGDCYACYCSEGWGGSACQKGDISSPFFLIAGVTIAVIVAVGAAIGMIFQVGNRELPGVISAGVGPARAQK